MRCAAEETGGPAARKRIGRHALAAACGVSPRASPPAPPHSPPPPMLPAPPSGSEHMLGVRARRQRASRRAADSARARGRRPSSAGSRRGTCSSSPAAAPPPVQKHTPRAPRKPSQLSGGRRGAVRGKKKHGGKNGTLQTVRQRKSLPPRSCSVLSCRGRARASAFRRMAGFFLFARTHL